MYKINMHYVHWLTEYLIILSYPIKPLYLIWLLSLFVKDKYIKYSRTKLMGSSTLESPKTDEFSCFSASGASVCNVW